MMQMLLENAKIKIIVHRAWEMANVCQKTQNKRRARVILAAAMARASGRIRVRRGRARHIWRDGKGSSKETRLVLRRV